MSTGGVAYSNFVNYLQENVGLFTTYQPVTVAFLPPEVLNLNNYTVLGSSVFASAHISLPPFNSYAAVDLWVNQLANYGCDVAAYLQIYGSAFVYVSNEDYSSANV